jgi:hypothetical protein
MKGFIIGFPKCGTTTIHEACIKSGLRSAHWKIPKGYCGKLIYARYHAGEDPLLDFADYDFVAQADVCRPDSSLNFWPNLDIDLLRTIRRYHPECCFILNTRDVTSHIASISSWGKLRRRITKSDIIGLPAGQGSEDDHLRLWIENHYQACRSAFANDEKFVELPITRSDESRQALEKALGVPITWWGVSPKTTTSQPAERNKAPKRPSSLAAL